MPSTDLPTTIVIFGASGDLTQRKLIPALCHLHRKGRLPEMTRIVGYARRPYMHEEFRKRMREGVAKLGGEVYDLHEWEAIAARLWYCRGDLDNQADYEGLRAFLGELEGGPANRLYYLAISPEFYAPVATHLGATGMARQDEGWRRIIIEKPFGHDLKSARALNQAVHAAFSEDQVYRIDHYLGKETAQNILFFRFANTIFEPIWNRNYVDHVQLTVAEDVDVGHRAGYYDQAGVLRDIFQNHILQLLTLVAMEPPASFNADAVRNEKVKVLGSVRSLPPAAVAEHTLRAQYAGYRQAPEVAPDSQTATYAALRLYVDNWRWQGVPFYLRSGKALATKTTEIIVQFRRPPHVLFNLPPDNRLTANFLSLCIQPDEGIHLRFETKVPDSIQETRSVNMDFHYSTTFGDEPLPDAYERLQMDALNGDASLFIRSDEIELAWQIMDPILEGWEGNRAPSLAIYEPGSWGPAESDAFMRRDGRHWRFACGPHSRS